MAVSLNILNIKESGPLCEICCRNFAKYTCPKCNIKYCSIGCYKSEKHAVCSEGFYKDSFMEALRHQNTISSSEKNKMLEMLKRVEENDSSILGNEGSNGDEDESLLQDRLSGLHVDSELDQVWERLTGEEKAQFNKMLQTGELAQLVEDTTPWWRMIPKVQFLDSDVDSTHHLPPLPTDLQPLASLLKSEVSPCVKYNVLNVLYSYVFTVRLFNSDHHSMALSATEVLLTICSVLSEDLSFSTVQDAVSHSMASIQTRSDLSSPQQYCVSLINEVILLMEPRGVACGNVLGAHALADVLKMVNKAKKQLKSSQPLVTKGSLEISKLLLVHRKLMFLLSWCVEKGRKELPLLKHPVGEIQEKLKTENIGNNAVPSRCLIQDIS